MPKVLFDTDVVIDHLAGRKPLPVEDGCYSVITRAELYAGTDVDEPAIDELLDALTEVPVDRDIAQEAGRLRRGSRLRLPDALIAATALATGSRLHTRNVRDFRGVKGLRLYG